MKNANFTANWKQLRALRVHVIDQDNVRVYDNLIKNKGKIFTLNAIPYVNFCNEFNIFYTSEMMVRNET